MRAQVWSLEVIVAAAVFMVVFVVVIGVASFAHRDPFKEVQSDTFMLTNTLIHDPKYAVVDEGKVDKEKFAQLAETNYTDLKKRFGVKSDFCIFIEDVDGKLVPIQVDGKNYSGIGNGSSILIGGKPCGQ